MTDAPAIIGATFTIGSALAGCAYYVVANVVELSSAVKGLTDTIKQQKEVDKERHADTHEAISAIRDVLERHHEDIGNVKARIALLEQKDPPPAAAMRTRRKAG